MLPSMPLISTPYKEGQNEVTIPEIFSEDQNQSTVKALDLSVTAKKSSPLKHVTPILRKYNSHRKVKGGKMGLPNEQFQPQSPERQSYRPIAPKPVMMLITPPGEDTASQKDMNESISVVKQETSETSDPKKANEERKDVRKDNEEELAALMLASTTIRSTKGRATNVRKKTKQIRDMETTIGLLTPDDPAVREEKSFGFAQAYFLKVKERLEGTELYHEFLHTMNEFGTSIIEVTDLYKKITSILRPHPDLSEEFLAFLLPEQAMQCGKLMQYLMITQMRDFFRRLEMYFEKQPQQMRKFYSALTSLGGQANVTMEDVRGAILPLLKGNSLLVEHFLNLLPEEKPQESMMTEFEEMDFGDKDYDHFKEEDLYETLVVPKQPDAFGGDGCACNCHNSRDDKYRNKAAHCLSCGTRFIHGKVFVHTGKVLRPAKVVFETETTKDSISRLSAKNRRRVRNRKRSITPFSNSPLKHARFIFGGIVGGASPKNSRTSKAKVSQKPRSSKSCQNLVKPKASNAGRSNKQNSVRSTSKSTGRSAQSRKPAASININALSNVNVKNTTSYAAVAATVIAPVQHTPSASGVILLDESAVLPPVLETAASGINDFSVLSHALHSAQEEPRSEIVAHASEQEDAILPEIVGTSNSNIRDFSSLSHILHKSREENRDEFFHEESGIVPEVIVTSEPDVETFLLLAQPVQDTQEDSNASQPISEEVVQIPNEESNISLLSKPDILNSSERNFSSFLDLVQSTCDETHQSKEAMDQGELQDKLGEKGEHAGPVVSGEPVFSSEVLLNSGEKEHEEHMKEEQVEEPMDESCQESDKIVGLCLDLCDSPHMQSMSASEGNMEEGKCSVAWTREEDKVILEMYKLEHSFQEISEQLPQRSVEEVKRRFEILINIMKQMTVEKMDEDCNSTVQ